MSAFNLGGDAEQHSCCVFTTRRLAWAIAAVFFPLATAAQDGTTPRSVRFREPHSTHYHLIQSNHVAGQKWMSARPANGSTNRVQLGNRVVLQVVPGTALGPLLTDLSLSLARTISPSLFILQASDSLAAIDAAEALSRKEGVVASYPVMRRALRRHDGYASAPNDSFFGDQWHLENRGSDGNLTGPDLNVRAGWSITRGEGVLVAVADDGFQLDHPDLVNRATGAPHFNFYTGKADGSPASSDADHATAVAGIIAAEQGNSLGVSGVAPQARLASWVIFGASFAGQDSVASDEQLMDMFQYASDRVAVQNHSWGNAGKVQVGLDVLSDAGVASATTTGRGGKGVVMVRAGGNSRSSLVNVNDDGFASDPRVIAVAAVRKDGRACSYSDPGACLLLAAPSGDVLDTGGTADGIDTAAPGIWTTDRTGSAGYNTSTGDSASYYGDFNGTSASAPQVTGVAALILSANSSLTYRDVQGILTHSARHFDLADPDLRTNGAGFLFSHNVGFGVPDAGFAVQLANIWTNRPASKRVTFENTTSQAIPDDSLRVVCAASGISSSLTAIRCLPSLGPHPDDPTAALPLVYVGQANTELTQDLHGKAALIQRGTSYFSDKIARAARAGAAFAIIFNNTGTTAIQSMGVTTYVPIPAVSVGQTDGTALRDFIAAHPETTARLRLTPAVYPFTVTDTLVCEHVGVRLKTTHTSRSDVRVTLVSPMGTRSVLQAINSDTSSGPSDWTYWSAQHYCESSAGDWRLEVSDERNTTVRTSPFTTIAATGSVTYAQLILDGVPITDTDRDGLDDDWERQHFGSLTYGPKEDPDDDGFNNAREQIMGTDPALASTAFKIEFAGFKSGFWRLSWPARDGVAYTVFSASDLSYQWSPLTNVAGRLPVSEFVVPSDGLDHFYRVSRQSTTQAGQ